MQEEKKNQEEIKVQEERKMENTAKDQKTENVQNEKKIQSKSMDFLEFIDKETQALNINGYKARLRMIAPEAASTFASTLYTLFGADVSKNLVEAYETVKEGGKDSIYYRAVIILFRNLPPMTPEQIIGELKDCCEHPELHIY